MKTNLSIIFLTLILAPTLYSQTFSPSWDRNYGGKLDEWNASIQETNDGNIVVFGFTLSFGAVEGMSYCWLLKLDANGDMLWSKTYGSGAEECYGGKQTSDGGYIMVGRTYIESKTSYFVYVVRTDSLGNTLWEKYYGSSSSNEGVKGIVETTDGGFVMAGWIEYENFEYDMLLIKINAEGDSLWSHTYSSPGYDAVGSVIETLDGGLITTGVTMRSAADSDPHLLLMKADATGNLIWTRTYGSRHSYGAFVEPTTDGGYIVTGSLYSGRDPHYDVWLLRTDSEGDTLWTRTYQFYEDGHNAGECVRQTPDGGFIISGRAVTPNNCFHCTDLFLMKTDPDGYIQWLEINEGQAETYLSLTQEGDYLLSGRGHVDHESFNTFVYKRRSVSLMANFETLDFGFVAPDSIETKELTLYNLGLLNLNFEIEPLEQSAFSLETSSGNIDPIDSLKIKVLYDPTNTSPHLDTLRIVGRDGTAEVILVGNETTGDIDSNGQIGVRNYRLEQNFPNPFNPTATIEYTLPQSEDVSLIVYNLIGQEVAMLVSENQQSGSYSVTWNASNFSSGIYFYRLQAGDFVQTRKMVLLK